MSGQTPSRTLDMSAPEHPSLDYNFLRKEGIRHISRLVGQLWTDYNAHDPGITILEQLCYALTDLAYRISHPVSDHLFEGEDNPYPSLFGPRRVLSCEPVTLEDLRKLVLDVDGVRNAWVERVSQQKPELYYDEARKQLDLRPDNPSGEPIQLKGLYRVIIEKSELSWHYGSTVERAVAERLHAHRGLCEDFEEVRVLDPVDVRVHAGLELGNIDSADTTIFEVYRAISEYLSPTIRFHTLQEMLAEGFGLDDILEGPTLEHGYIRPQDLQRLVRRQQLHTSDLIRTILDIPGVRAVRNISVSMGDSQPENWSLDIGASRVARLVLTNRGTTSLTISAASDRIPIAVHDPSVQQQYKSWLESRGQKQALSPADLDLRPPSGQSRDVANYHAIQRQLPSTYGIGDLGLAPSVSTRRKLQAKQLQGYLTFYDQLLANYFAHLDNVKHLFSFREDSTETYFCQELCAKSIKNVDVWRDGDGGKGQAADVLAQTISKQRGVARKSKFLNHLLARFGEDFTEYSLVLFGALTAGGEEVQPATVQEQLNRDKQAFLRAYPEISSRRGRGFNYLNAYGEENCSGLEQRLAVRLGFSRDLGEACLVVEHILLRPIVEDRNQLSADEFGRLPLLAAAHHRDPYSLQLSVLLPAWPPRFQVPSFREFVEQTIRAETPAHLSVYVRWLDQAAWDAFSSAHRQWLEIRRRSWQG